MDMGFFCFAPSHFSGLLKIEDYSLTRPASVRGRGEVQPYTFPEFGDARKDTDAK
jgi:hypothetical protein